MIRIIQLTIILSAQFSWAQLSQTSGLLWKIERDDLSSPSYLYGSFHTNDRRVFDWMDSTYIALQNCETIALEVDLFDAFDLFEPRNSDLKLKFDNQGKVYTTVNDASDSYYGDEDGMPQVLDASFQQYCLNAGKKFYPLETIESQLNILGGSSNNWFEGKRWSFVKDAQEKFLVEYLKSDVEELDKMMRSSLGVGSDYYKSLIIDRNKDMFVGLDTLMSERNGVFCAVGAGHLGGNRGIIQILRNNGYSVRKVEAGSTKNRKEILTEYRKFNSCEFINDTLGLVAKFYGKPMEIENEYESFLVGYEYIELGQGNHFKIEVYPLEEEVSLEQFAEEYINLPEEAMTKIIDLENGSQAIEGISENYREGITWKRIVPSEKYLFVLIAKGGNKFMNSPRPQLFFDGVFVK